VQARKAASAAARSVLVPVQCNRRTSPLHRTHALPERLVVAADAKLGVAIIGDDGQDRFEFEFASERGNAQPGLAFDRGAKIVNTQQIAR